MKQTWIIVLGVIAGLLASRNDAYAGIDDVANMTHRSDGGWNVTCHSGAHQIATDQQIKEGFVCDQTSLAWKIVGDTDHCATSTCAVRDPATGILWAGQLEPKDLFAAQASCQQFRGLGHSGWHLATVNQLRGYFEELYTMADRPFDWFGTNTLEYWVSPIEPDLNHEGEYAWYHRDDGDRSEYYDARLGVRCDFDGWNGDRPWSLTDLKTGTTWTAVEAKGDDTIKQTCSKIHARVPSEADWTAAIRDGFMQRYTEYPYMDDITLTVNAGGQAWALDAHGELEFADLGINRNGQPTLAFRRLTGTVQSYSIGAYCVQ